MNPTDGHVALVAVALLLGKVGRGLLILRLPTFRFRRILLRIVAEQYRGDLLGGTENSPPRIWPRLSIACPYAESTASICENSCSRNDHRRLGSDIRALIGLSWVAFLAAAA